MLRFNTIAWLRRADVPSVHLAVRLTAQLTAIFLFILNGRFNGRSVLGTTRDSRTWFLVVSGTINIDFPFTVAAATVCRMVTMCRSYSAVDRHRHGVSQRTRRVLHPTPACAALPGQSAALLVPASCCVAGVPLFFRKIRIPGRMMRAPPKKPVAFGVPMESLKSPSARTPRRRHVMHPLSKYRLR